MKEKDSHFIIAGDLNIQPHMKTYSNFNSILEPLQIKDIFYEVNKKHEITFGVLDENNKPIETVLTREADYGKNEVLDYIFSDLDGKSCEINHFSEFDKNQLW